MVRALLRVIYITLQDSIRLSQTFSNHFENTSLLQSDHRKKTVEGRISDRMDVGTDQFPIQWPEAKRRGRNIASQYYYRLLQSQNKIVVENEMKEITAPMQKDKLEFIKNPVVAEFLGLAPNSDFSESRLEGSIITHLQKFIMEMGKGYAFVARQQHIHTDMGDFYIDLVFYNYILKCFLLIDLKTTQISHQDVGQMDMYVRMYDELKRTDGDNPTIGLILCSKTSEDMAKYSILKENKQLFQAKYLTYLPTEEQLRHEIERQKEIFMQQQANKEQDR